MNQLKTTVLLASMSGLLIFASGLLFGGARGAFLGLVLAAVMNLGSWFYSDKIALAAYGAQPVNRSQAPHLYAMLEQLCDRAGMPVPTLHIIPSPMANAFATGRDPNHAAVAVTEGILEILPEDELAAVIAHELSHIRNRDTLTQAVAATIAGAISYLAQAAMWFGGDRDRLLGPLPTGPGNSNPSPQRCGSRSRKLHQRNLGHDPRAQQRHHPNGQHR